MLRATIVLLAVVAVANAGLVDYLRQIKEEEKGGDCSATGTEVVVPTGERRVIQSPNYPQLYDETLQK